MKRKILPLNALRSFEAAARLGRQTAAADELGVTHGAVSRQIQQLEAYLGLELFEGARSNPALTAAGKHLLPPLTSAFDSMRAAIQSILDEEEGLLDVACLSSFAMRWLIPRLHRFQQLHPGIDVRLSTDDRRIDLLQGRFDVSITVLDSQAKTNAMDVVLFAEKMGIVLAPSLLKQVNTRHGSLGDLRFAVLEQLPLLTTRTRPNALAIWLEANGQQHMKTDVRKKHADTKTIEYEHYYFAIEAAACGLGACIVPMHLVAADVASGRLVAPSGFLTTGYRYIARRLRPSHKKSILFCDWLKAQAAEPA